MQKLGLYIHIPFCVKKCNYCDFYSVRSTDENMTEYVKTIIRSFDYWKHNLPYSPIVDTVYLGGGTPSILGTDLLSEILDSVSKHYTLDHNTEITLECNPNSLINLDLFSLKSLGLNRISMGLQSSNDNELKVLGRSHTTATAVKAIDTIHKSGIKNFSLDVMTGIPLQTFESLSDTIDFCLDSGATHISTYMLKIEENTLFYKKRNLYNFADDDTHADFYEFTCNKLKNNDFRHYEISNFCKNNMIPHHNMKYWQLDDYLGIGPSAHSMINNKRFFYPRTLKEYSPENYIYDSEGKTPEEFIMLSLRTDIGFDYNEFESIFHKKLSDEFNSKVLMFSKMGLIKQNSNSFSLTEMGFLVSNTIISQLIESTYL